MTHWLHPGGSLMSGRNHAILIPSLDPPDAFVSYIENLIAGGFDSIIIVDDGSSTAKKPLFERLDAHPECTVITHAVNLGKGRALKNGFNHFLNEQDVDSRLHGVITVDCDGQHAVEDVIRLDETACDEDTLFLGSRAFFKNPDVPFKSRFGNSLTSAIFRILYGAKLADTQTGLRAIPKSHLAGYMTLAGERFEYETHMLIDSIHRHVPIRELDIETIYFDSNAGTHFAPIRDSLAIYGLIFSSFIRFTFSALSSALIDLGVFQILVMALHDMPQSTSIWSATIAARTVSSMYNYFVNKNYVFLDEGSVRRTLWRYYFLAAAQMACSAGSVAFLCRMLPLPATLVKILVDSTLFVLSYQIQRRFVFNVQKAGAC